MVLKELQSRMEDFNLKSVLEERKLESVEIETLSLGAISIWLLSHSMITSNRFLIRLSAVRN